jgi:hypothetical protein
MVASLSRSRGSSEPRVGMDRPSGPRDAASRPGAAAAAQVHRETASAAPAPPPSNTTWLESIPRSPRGRRRGAPVAAPPRVRACPVGAAIPRAGLTL